MVSPMKILPDPAFDDLKPRLADRLTRLAASISAGQFLSFLDPLMHQVLHQGFSEVQAQEGTVWLLDEAGDHLIPSFNTGPESAKLLAEFRQPVNTGLISMVLASEQPFLENEVWKNAQQSKLLDDLLQTRTYAMIAVPFYILQACRGVISCVQLKKQGDPGPDPPGFRPEHLAAVQRTSAVLSRLFELRLLSLTVGWTSD